MNIMCNNRLLCCNFCFFRTIHPTAAVKRPTLVKQITDSCQTIVRHVSDNKDI